MFARIVYKILFIRKPCVYSMSYRNLMRRVLKSAYFKDDCAGSGT